jgi:hypothetical protein
VEKAHYYSGEVFGFYADAKKTAFDAGLIENALQDFKLLGFKDATPRRSAVHSHSDTLDNASTPGISSLCRFRAALAARNATAERSHL